MFTVAWGSFRRPRWEIRHERHGARRAHCTVRHRPLRECYELSLAKIVFPSRIQLWVIPPLTRGKKGSLGQAGPSLV
jgi:hypothetical protein